MFCDSQTRPPSNPFPSIKANIHAQTDNVTRKPKIHESQKIKPLPPHKDISRIISPTR
ncbi:MAG: hypothetical protein LBE18_07965 [Planctomycetaceae bacterium]|nr:hypothetical protein [Planctomycetaceae bacterium]